MQTASAVRGRSRKSTSLSGMNVSHVTVVPDRPHVHKDALALGHCVAPDPCCDLRHMRQLAGTALVGAASGAEDEQRG
jgi:hypothetical protein